MQYLRLRSDTRASKKGKGIMRRHITAKELRMNKNEIIALMKDEIAKAKPWYYTKSVLLDILNYERLTLEELRELGR